MAFQRITSLKTVILISIKSLLACSKYASSELPAIPSYGLCSVPTCPDLGSRGCALSQPAPIWGVGAVLCPNLPRSGEYGLCSVPTCPDLGCRGCALSQPAPIWGVGAVLCPNLPRSGEYGLCSVPTCPDLGCRGCALSQPAPIWGVRAVLCPNLPRSGVFHHTSRREIPHLCNLDHLHGQLLVSGVE